MIKNLSKIVMNFALASSVVLASSHSAFASDWGNFKDDGCVDLGGGRTARSYSAVLWNIPWGESWEDACSQKDASVKGHYFSHPTACVKASAASAIGAIGALVSVVGLSYPPAGVAGTIIGGSAVLLDLGGAGALNMWGVFYVAEDNCQDSRPDSGPDWSER